MAWFEVNGMVVIVLVMTSFIGWTEAADGKLETPIVVHDYSSEIQLKWNKWNNTDAYIDSQGGSVSLSYKVEYRKNGTEQWTEYTNSSIVGSDQLSVNVSGLGTYAYQVRVILEEEIVNGTHHNVAYSDPVLKCGKPDRPKIELTTGCHSARYNSTYVQLSWTVDSRCDGNADYTIGYQTSGHGSIWTEIDNVTSPYRWVKLFPNVGHNVQVTTQNRLGRTSSSRVKNIKTNTSGINGRPKPVNVTTKLLADKKTSTLHFDWQTSGDTTCGPISSYILGYRQTDAQNPDFTNVTLSASTFNYSLYNLPLNTEYQIRLTVITTADESFTSLIKTVTTADGRPPAPSVTVDTCSNYITLYVTPPYPPHAELTRVVVECYLGEAETNNPDFASSKPLINQKDPVTITFSGDDMKSGENYTCRAMLVDSENGTSVWTNIKAITEDGKSRKPPDFVTSNGTADSVVLNWKTPKYRGGVIEKYMLVCEAVEIKSNNKNLTTILTIDYNNPFGIEDMFNRHMYTMNELRPSTLYSCSVLAVNTAGNGDKNALIFWTEQNEKTTEPPGRFPTSDKDKLITSRLTGAAVGGGFCLLIIIIVSTCLCRRGQNKQSKPITPPIKSVALSTKQKRMEDNEYAIKYDVM